MDFLEFGDALQEVRGAMNQGRLKLTDQGVIFKNSKTGRVDQFQTSDIDTVFWQRIAGAFGLRISLKSGQLFRFGGFKENDFEKLSKFFLHTINKTLIEKDLSLKGWNWGTAKFYGPVLSFDIDNVSAFEIPLLNVSHCTTAKNEVTLEFHQNDDAAVSLMELRFHVPTDASGDLDPVQAFRDNVLPKASIIQATGDAISTFKEVQCLTPRGRYDIKIFPSFIQLHGKTFDYKIPMTTVLRLFLLPHRDQRQMFFVVSLDPPIKQGQTRYHFLILLFNKEEETTLEVGLSEKDIQEKYENKIQREMTGPTFEVMSRIMKVLVQRKITVPGLFVGNSGTSAVACSYRAAAGFMYPLERGFIYVHKPPVHIRFDEVASVNFARSGGSTRSFDFEVETKSGVVHTFSSIEKEEYGKLYDFITQKKLRVKNRGQLDQPNYNEEMVDSDVEDEPDAYLMRVKAEAKEREAIGGESDDDGDESDVSFNPGEGSGSEVAEEYDSNAESSSSSDDEEGEGGKSDDAGKRKIKEKEKKSKKAKTVPEERKPRKKKKDKDENRPKRPQSAYFLWLNESRDRLKEEFPGLSITELSKKAGEAWKEVKDKSRWEKLSVEAKKEYEKAMAEYKASGGGASSEKSKNDKGKKQEKSQQKSPAKSPMKSLGSYKSKEYISSSEGSSSEDGNDSKKKSKVKKEKGSGSEDDKKKKSKVTQEKADSDNESGSGKRQKKPAAKKGKKKSSDEEAGSDGDNKKSKKGASKVAVKKEKVPDASESEEEEEVLSTPESSEASGSD